MKNRYIYFKTLFPGYAIFFIKDKKYRSMGIDKKLIKYRNTKYLSYIEITNDFEIRKITRKENKYNEYVIKESLLILANNL